MSGTGAQGGNRTHDLRLTKRTAVMEWVKLYTTFHDHRKTVELDANAIALWTLCLSWSGAQEADGFIPRRIALRFLGGELGDEAAARLVRVGLWEEIDGGYRMRNWDERQDGADLVQARRAANRERQQRWRDRRHASRNALRDASVTGAREEESREDQKDSPLPPLRGKGLEAPLRSRRPTGRSRRRRPPRPRAGSAPSTAAPSPPRTPGGHPPWASPPAPSPRRADSVRRAIRPTT